MSWLRVLPKVDELQSGADVVAHAQRICIVNAIQMQQQAPNRVGGTRAVVQQLGFVGVAFMVTRFAYVLLKCAEQSRSTKMHGQIEIVQWQIAMVQRPIPNGSRGPFTPVSVKLRCDTNQPEKSLNHLVVLVQWRCLHRQCRLQCAQSCKWPRWPVASEAGTTKTLRESFRSAECDFQKKGQKWINGLKTLPQLYAWPAHAITDEIVALCVLHTQMLGE
jgi:hypothetical protein